MSVCREVWDLAGCYSSHFNFFLQKEADPFIDVMSCLDEVDGCLARAEHNSKACLEGITKAGLALKETKGDSDIHCIVLVKRTELLYIAVR